MDAPDRTDWPWLRVRQIQQLVATHFGLTCAEIRGPKRHKVVARARMMAMGIARILTQRSYPELGQLFGGRDHTTVLYSCRKFQHHLDYENPDATQLLEHVRQRLDPDRKPPEPVKGDPFVDELVRAGVRKPEGS